MPPSYRERLRTEGLALAACGAIGSAALLVFVPESRKRPESTIGQLAVLVVLLELFGKRSVRRWMRDAKEVSPDDAGSGEPTPLWMLPPIVAGLAAIFVLLPETGLPLSDRAGWDAGLRITLGSMLAGLAQATRFQRWVAEDEAAHHRRYVRVKGSRLLGGTTLGYSAT